MHTTDATQPFRDWAILEDPRRWERRMTMRLEGHTANLPSALLRAAVIAMGVATILLLAGKTPESLFVALWAAPYLLIGVCSKLVKAGNLRQEDRAKVGETLEEQVARHRRLRNIAPPDAVDGIR